MIFLFIYVGARGGKGWWGDEGLGASCCGCLDALDDVLGSALVRVHVLVVADAAFSGSDAQVGRQIKFERALSVVLAAGPRNLDVLALSALIGLQFARLHLDRAITVAVLVVAPEECDTAVVGPVLRLEAEAADRLATAARDVLLSAPAGRRPDAASGGHGGSGRVRYSDWLVFVDRLGGRNSRRRAAWMRL